MRIAVGNDHAGYPLRAPLIELIESSGHQVVSFGTDNEHRGDYPCFAAEVARAVRDGQANLGVVICGTGIGSSIAANKIEGVYCALCSDPYSARMARRHNDANVISLGARVLGPDLAVDILKNFLETQPSNEPRHVRRRQQVQQIEAGNELARE